MKSATLVNFLFEASSLKRLQRTGWQILGDNQESVAEHSYMVAVVSLVLALEENANLEKTLLIAIFHDFEEVRTGDVYKLADLYTKTAKNKAVQDAFSKLPRFAKISGLLKDYEVRKSKEAIIVKDADTLALCFELKLLMEKGNEHAGEWFEANIASLKTKAGKSIALELKKANSQRWWLKERKILHKKLTE